MLCIVPLKITGKIFHCLFLVPETTRVFMDTFYRAKRRFNKWIVIGGSRTGKELWHRVIFQQPAYRFSLHLAAPVINYEGYSADYGNAVRQG